MSFNPDKRRKDVIIVLQQYRGINYKKFTVYSFPKLYARIKTKARFIDRTFHDPNLKQSTVEPPRATTSRRLPPPMSDRLPKTPKIFLVKALYWNLS